MLSNVKIYIARLNEPYSRFIYLNVCHCQTIQSDTLAVSVPKFSHETKKKTLKETFRAALEELGLSLWLARL